MPSCWRKAGKAEQPEINLEVVSEEPTTGVKYLFTTKTCPNCARAKEILEDEDYILVDAEEQVDMTKKYGVMQAPTLVVVNGDDVKRYANASNIQKYVDEN